MYWTSYRSGKPLFVMAIYFAKAFDSVDRVAPNSLVALLRALMWHWWDPYLIDVVDELCTGDYADIFKGEMNIGIMKVNKRIRQGCTGSPK